jgi:hypothetical protein
MKKTPTLQTATAICIALAAMFASCRDDKVKITGLDLKELDNVTIKVGETKTMSAKITPASYNAKPDEFTITSTPASIATATGTVQGSTVTVSVTGVSPGDATVAIKHTSGLQESRVIKVVPPDIVLESIAVTGEPTKKVYELNESFLPAGITVTATYNYGSPAAIALNNADLAFVYDFATSGTKTVTVRYTLNGVTKETNIAGITVNEPEPVLQSILVNRITDHKNFGIGEPLNSAEKEWTVTATFDKGEPKTIANNDPELTWSNSFSETAGTSKSVTVTYKGQNSTITGINVQTFAQRIGALHSVSEATTIYLYADEDVNDRIQPGGNTNITLLGVDKERTLYRTEPPGEFLTLLWQNTKLTLGDKVTLDGSKMQNNIAPLVRIGDYSVFTMLDGSKITGNNNTYSINHNSGGAVQVQSYFEAKFIMEGGIITGNKASAYGGGVHVLSGSFEMRGGEITGNEAYLGSDVSLYRISGAEMYQPTLKLKDNSKIGNLTLFTNYGYGIATATINGNFTGSVGSLDMVGEHSFTNIKDMWVDKQIIKSEGITLTSAMLQRFTLGNFVLWLDGTKQALTPGYHLYGTKTGETDTDRFGRLVAD